MRQFTVDEYHRLINAGVIREGERIELLEGWLVQRTPIQPPHAVAVGLTSDRIDHLLSSDWIIRVRQPITLSGSEPEPDVSVARGKDRDYLGHHPNRTTTGLVIEVADSTLDKDRTVMARIYARDNLPVYWIVNINDEQIEVYTDPTGDCDEPVYRNRRDYHRGEEVPLVLDGVEIARIPVADLLP